MAFKECLDVRCFPLLPKSNFAKKVPMFVKIEGVVFATHLSTEQVLS